MAKDRPFLSRQSFLQDSKGHTVPVSVSPFYRITKDRLFLSGSVLFTGYRGQTVLVWVSPFYGMAKDTLPVGNLLFFLLTTHSSKGKKKL